MRRGSRDPGHPLGSSSVFSGVPCCPAALMRRGGARRPGPDGLRRPRRAQRLSGCFRPFSGRIYPPEIGPTACPLPTAAREAATGGGRGGRQRSVTTAIIANERRTRGSGSRDRITRRQRISARYIQFTVSLNSWSAHASRPPLPRASRPPLPRASRRPLPRVLLPRPCPTSAPHTVPMTL